MMDGTALAVSSRHVEEAVQGWLHDKAQRSQSEHTRRAYERTIASFREALGGVGLELDSAPELVAKVAQVWASKRDAHASRQHAAYGQHVKGATYNQRLACLSSFYTFCQRRGMAGISVNPMQGMERHSDADRDHAKVLEPDGAKALLAKIDRSTVAGLRDYALLSVAFMTARRAMELAGLRLGDVEVDGAGAVTLHFRRCKGGKQKEDRLPDGAGKALLRYIDAAHGPTWAQLPKDMPLWVSLSRNKGKQHGLSTQAIADIWQKRIGVSTVHSTRHTWAKMMHDKGAPLLTISERLGHTNIAITSRYLHAMPQPINPFAGQLAADLGIG